MSPLQEELMELLDARRGHFLMESRRHCDLWLELDVLFLRPGRLRPFVDALAQKLSGHDIDVVCGPMTGGALLAQTIARDLDLEFCYSERLAPAPGEEQDGVEYRIPNALRTPVRGRSVAVVDDVISAGSAVRGTLEDLLRCGANTVAIGSLLVLGRSAAVLAADLEVTLESVGHLSAGLWTASDCPLCASQVPLEVVPARP